MDKLPTIRSYRLRASLKGENSSSFQTTAASSRLQKQASAVVFISKEKMPKRRKERGNRVLSFILRTVSFMFEDMALNVSRKCGIC
jgi:hypothetical protein